MKQILTFNTTTPRRYEGNS